MQNDVRVIKFVGDDLGYGVRKIRMTITDYILANMIKVAVADTYYVEV